MIIGFGYKAGAGKDTSGDYLVSKYGFVKDSFAGTLKALCKSVLGLSEFDVNDSRGKAIPFDRPLVVTEVLYYKLYSAVLKSLLSCEVDVDLPFPEQSSKVLYTPREVLQFIGTDIIRQIYPRFHVDTLLYRCAHRPAGTVICDIRFPDEKKAIESAGGITVKLCRESYLSGSTASHISENALNGAVWQYVIQNDSSLGYLYSQLDILVGGLQDGRQCYKKEDC